MSDLFDLTILIKTFERPDCLEKCINSIRKYYPTILILIADDSDDAQTIIKDNLEIYKLPFDKGLSYGRNYLLDRVNTKYFVLLDDDFEFCDDTKLEIFKEILDSNPEIDLVGGGLREPNGKITHYELDFDKRKSILKYIKQDKRTVNGYNQYDIVLNFFIARTDKIKQIRWDNDLKIVEHTDFFLRAKEKGLVCVYCEKVIVNHNKNYNDRPKYDKYRYNYKEYYNLLLNKHNLKEIIPL